MDPTGVANRAAENLLSQGTLGTFIVLLLLFLLALGWTVRGLYQDNQGLHGRIAEIFAKAVAAVEASTAALVESRGTLQSLGSAVETLGKALGELSHESEKHDTDVRHGLANTSMALVGLKERLDKIHDRLERLERIERAIERSADYVEAPPARTRGPR